jgi:gamma-glutamylputrescine oxidase
MNNSHYQSPISPGYSWYEATAGERPQYEPLDGDRSADVVVIGGGFTGLSAAAHLAKAGADVVLIEAHRFGDGASGRNGGQLGTGQRAWAEELEGEYGFTRAKALFDLAEEAKSHLLEFAETNGIDIDYMPGQMSVVHKKRYLADYRAHPEIMATRFGYPHISFMEAEETARRHDALPWRHPRHRHRAHPPAQARHRHGEGRGGGRRQPARADEGHRH